MNIASGSGNASGIAELRSVIDAAPLPAGAEKLDESVNDGHGDTTARIERQYRLASDSGSTDDIQQVLVAAQYRVLDLQTGKLADVPDGSWSRSVSATAGDVTVLPPGRHGGGIAYLWQGDKLRVTVLDGALQD